MTRRSPMNADELGKALRESTASDADMARMEASLGRALRARQTPSSSAPRFVWIGAGLALAVAAIFWMTRATPAPQVAETNAPVPSAPALHTGSDLASGDGQLGNAHLAVTDGSLAHVDDDAIAHAAVTLARGEVHVAFHPVHRGEEHLAIVTDLARVEVVGTEFVVTRGDDATHVRVIEGVVRVVTLSTSEEHVLRAGDALDVVREAEAAIEVEREVEVEVEHEHERSASAADAEAAADRGDVDALIRISDHGEREARLTALEELADRSRGTDPSASIGYCTRVLALDPAGGRGATALYDRGRLHESANDDAAAADDYALYLSRFPHGELAAQAQQRLCALDPSRCSAP